MAKEVHVILKGDCYSMNTYCSTLKEFLEMRNLKRSDVSDYQCFPIFCDVHQELLAFISISGTYACPMGHWLEQ